MEINIPNLELKDTPSKGKGIFSRITFPTGTTIFEVTGRIVQKDSIPKPYAPEVDNYFQIGATTYIGLSGSYDDFINHSCNPNCWVYIVGTRAFIVALRQINPGDELTFDYSTTSSETTEEWAMPCCCGSFGCRKLISGFDYLDDKRKEEYIRMGIVPTYLIKGNK